jgi:predicted ABC-type ATPase
MRAAPAAPELVVLAGPNGAGKSTFFELYLRQTGVRFVNADLIARALSPSDPTAVGYAAAAAAEAERRALLAARESFCMETVFSDPAGAKLAFLKEARAAGYGVRLIFIGLDSAQLSEARVVQRVLSGGHDVPTEKLEARFPRTLANLEAALALVEDVDLFDNSDAERPYRLFARKSAGRWSKRRPPIPRWAARLVW